MSIVMEILLLCRRICIATTPSFGQSAPRDLGSIKGDGHRLNHFPVDLRPICRGFCDHGGRARDQRLDTPDAHQVRGIRIAKVLWT
jgi:hypothetical protein